MIMKGSSRVKVLFLGTPLFAVPCLEILKTIDFVDVAGVITHPDKPKGRRLVVTPPPVKISAQKHDLTIYQPERVSSPDFLLKLKEIECDLIVIVSFGEILKKDVLRIPKLGCINVHTSLLPKYRGAAPITWALMNDEARTGVTTFWLTEKADSGDIILQKDLEISAIDNRGTIEEKLSHLGAELLRETIIKIHKGNAVRIPQDESKATYAPKIKKEDGLINWTMPARNIHNKIRAMNPWPGAYTYLNGLRIEVWEGELIEDISKKKEKEGAIVVLDEAGIGIQTGDGILLIKELQAEGKKRLKAKDFIHGYRLNEGQDFENASGIKA